MMATGELFGPVSESGWSVAHAQDAADITRENVSAVFDTCETETRAASRHFSVLQFADMKGFDVFARTDFDVPTDQRVPDLPDGLDRGEGIGMTAENASMGDLVGALHSLGQFFDDHLDDASSPAVGRGHARLPSETPSERRVRAIVGVGSVLSVLRTMLTLIARPPTICLVARVRTSISAQRRTPSPHPIRLDRVKSGIDRSRWRYVSGT